MTTNNIAYFNEKTKLMLEMEKIKKNDLLHPQAQLTVLSNETILIYDLSLVASTEQKNIKLPITGTNYTISYSNTKTNETETDDSNFPTITLNGGKKYTVKINGLVEHFGGNNDNGEPLDGVEYLVEAVKLGPLNLSQAFFGASKLIKVPTKLPSGVTDMSYMFYFATSFNQPLNNWNVSKVENMTGMFNGATSFNQPLNSWVVRNVLFMDFMFYDATNFNQPLNNWDVSDVTLMYNMFYGATSFNQPLNVWVVSEVTNMSNMFNGATSFNQPLNMWVVSSVIDMTGMFQNATSFNQPLNNWDVSSVKDMNNMFANAISFNQPLNNWNISSVGDIYLNQNMQNMINGSLNSMFENATSFNQSLHKWNISNPDNNCKNMLDYSGLSQYNYQNTLIGWYNKCKSLLFVPKKIGAKGMIYNKYNKWGISNNTSGNGAISTTTSWILHNDSDKNIFREARSYFDDFIDGDMEVNFG